MPSSKKRSSSSSSSKSKSNKSSRSSSTSSSSSKKIARSSTNDAHEGRGRNASKILQGTSFSTALVPVSKKKSTALMVVSSSSSGKNNDKDNEINDDASSTSSSKTSKKGSKSVHDTYRKLSGIEHILHRPELYVGMMDKVTEIWWVPSTENPNRMHRRSITFSPALFKIFDEILVNAADNKMRSKHLQTAIHVSVNLNHGTISVYNDGPGIPVVRHKVHNLYIPHLIFGHLLTSSNYDDNESKITGGRHGYGAKLTNVFSKEFTVETVRNGVHYEKSWSKNMSMSHHECINNSYKGKDFTKITFKPDVKRFGMTELDESIVHLFHRRTLDVAATCGVAVHWNGAKAEVNSFLDYALHFLPKKNTRVLISLQGSTNLGGERPLSAVSAAAQEAASLLKSKRSSSNSSKDNKVKEEKSSSSSTKKDTSKEATAKEATQNQQQQGKDDVIEEPELDQDGLKQARKEFSRLMHEIKLASPSFTRRDCLVFHQKSRHWDVVLAFHLDGGVDKNDHVSFVNNVATHNGGSHLRHVQEKVIDHLVAGVKPHLRKEIARLLRSMLQIFVNAIIHNPTFGSQIKDKLITPESNFLATFNLNPKIKEAFHFADLSKRIIEFAQNQLGLAAQRNAMRSVRIHGRVSLPKLEDANWAGSDKANQCTLILTEGDSAKALAISGLAVIGRDKFGVYPLKGKLMNAREQTLKRVAENDQFSDIMKAMGLRFNTRYDPADPQLRYGRIMIMADQDHDGSHIKGLVMNFIHTFWPSLLERPGFITQFITPIIKALPRSKSDAVVPRSFFSIPDFQRWKAALRASEQRRYYFKYYKGLGTSTSAEGREYFQNIDRHEIVMLRNSSQPKLDDNAMELAFASDQIDGRKIWVSSYSLEEHVGVDFRKKTLTYGDFIHKELILFSVADCERSIPSVIDGLKPSQRKILYAAFKRNLTKSVKVAQFCGVVGEISGYHHGEASLQGAIVGLAQDFVGSNNINFLLPEGQFGTRHEGGKDHASARYIFTRLNPITRHIFPVEDDPLLKYRDDDGFPIEPHYYVPIIPTILVNGAAGIGTGFATNVPSYHPLEIISNVRRLLNKKKPHTMKPWYDGFSGDFHLHKELPPPVNNDVPFHRRNSYASEEYYYTTNVVYIGSDSTIINVDDLAPGTATATIKKILVDLVREGKVKDFVENHTPSTVSFTVEVETSGTADEQLAAEIAAQEEAAAAANNSSNSNTTKKLGDGSSSNKKKEVTHKRAPIIEDAAAAALAKQKEKILNQNVAQVFHELTRRRTTFRTTNMYAFDRYGSLRLFECVDDILVEHFEVRLQLYKMRYEYMMMQLEHQLAVETSKYNFIKSVLSGTLKFRTLRNESALLTYIKNKKIYAKNFGGKPAPSFTTTTNSNNEENDEVSDENNNSNKKSSHHHQNFGQRVLLGNANTNVIIADEDDSLSNQKQSSETVTNYQYKKKFIRGGDENEGDAIIVGDDEEETSNKNKKLSSNNNNNNSLNGATGYEYLMRLPISSFNKQNVARSLENVRRCQESLENHKNMSPKKYYKQDLSRLEEEITKYFEEREKARQAEAPLKTDDESSSRSKNKNKRSKSSSEQKGKTKKRNDNNNNSNNNDDDEGGKVSRLAQLASEKFFGSATRDPSALLSMSTASISTTTTKTTKNFFEKFTMMNSTFVYEDCKMLWSLSSSSSASTSTRLPFANTKTTIKEKIMTNCINVGKSIGMKLPRFIF